MTTLRPDDGSPATRRLIELPARLRNLEIDQLDTLSVEEDIRAALDDVRRSLSGEGQARVIIIDARGGGLGFDKARRGVMCAVDAAGRKLDSVTVIGDAIVFIGGR